MSPTLSSFFRMFRDVCRTAPLPLGCALTAQVLALFTLPSLLGVVAQAAVVCCLLDARARWSESLRMERSFRRYGPRDRLLRLASSSRCQRDAALAAARRAGCLPRVETAFRAMGYRWFHLTPDAVARNPLYVLHPRFLAVTFAVRDRR